MLSGWNCTPWIGSTLWRKPITDPSSAVALTISAAGMSPTFSVGKRVAVKGEVTSANSPVPSWLFGEVLPCISHDGTGVFAEVPSPFIATRYHSLIVDDIPAELIVNATADDGAVMGFRHATLPIHGVQFHPESIATEHGHKLLDNFLKLTTQPNRALA